MVNFPSLLVSEEDDAAIPDLPEGGSTVHSWINADFVPSWLRPFTLDANTRFTRTPDHLLRPPEELPPSLLGNGAGMDGAGIDGARLADTLPLPSFGTAGASWHFLEMPLDLDQDAPPLPSVKADLEALEQAFADLPALRAAREGAVTAEADLSDEWNADSDVVPVSWSDPLPPPPAQQGSLEVQTEPSWLPADGTIAHEAGPAEPLAFEAPELTSPAAEEENGSPLATVGASDAIGWSFPMDEAPALDDAHAEPADLDDFDDGVDAIPASALLDWGLVPEPEASNEAASVVFDGPGPESWPAPAEGLRSELPASDGMLEGVPMAGAGELAIAEESAHVGAFADNGLMHQNDAIEALAAPFLSDFDAPLAGEGEPEAGSPWVAAEAPMDPSEEAWGLGDDPCDPLLSGLSAEPEIPAQAVPLGTDFAHPETAAHQPSHQEGAIQKAAIQEAAIQEAGAHTVSALAEDARGVNVASAVELPDVPFEGALAQLAAAALDDAAALLDSVTPGHDPEVPAHLRPLARMIVLGRLALTPAGEQDLHPPEPAAEPEPAPAEEPKLVQAHFAWQSYHLTINVDAPARAPAAAQELVPTALGEAALGEAALGEAALGEAAVGEDALAGSAAAETVGGCEPEAGIEADAVEDAFGYHLPPLDLLREPPHVEPDFELSEEFLDQSSASLQQILRDFGIRGEVIDANPGPVVTLYEFEPAPGVKSSRVIALAPDIARSMSAVSVRVAVVEGRNVIGIELPNRRRETVWLRELLASQEFDEARAKLGFCLGKTIGGAPVIADLARMPHLLVAGTTGSGKSVAINTMILSLLYRHTPDACRLIMIDPKMLELSVYEGIPHLLTPVVTDPKKAIIALKWAVKEMEDRYRKMARLAVRNIDGYNARMAEAREKAEVITRQVQVGFDKENGEALYEEQEMDLTALPYIVIIVDEMADLMMVAGKEIEGAIQRLAQMARAAGIHLVMATQRPSVDVITGTIKANFPTRISFQVTSKIDSRTILGEMGAETLLGQGDMLFMAGGGRITRVHGPFVSDGEVEHVVSFLKAQGGPEYLEDVIQDEDAEGPGGDDAVFDKSELADAGGDLYDQAVAIVLRDRKASTSYIQRRLQVGYNKAASLMERMENEGIVGPANHAGKREILSFSRPD